MTSEQKRTKESAVVILAAGKGTRMCSQVPKVLHPIGNAPMLHHAMRAASALRPDRTIVIVSEGADAVGAAVKAYDSTAEVVVQAQQLGTGHAALMSREALFGFEGDLFVMFGDTPFISPETLIRMRSMRDHADLVALGFETEDAGRYGRFVFDGDGLIAIVEAKDATPNQLDITTCNSGLMAGDCGTMLRLLARLGNANAQGEYYLTDLVGAAVAEGRNCKAVLCDEAETLGVNDRVQLSQAEAIFQARMRQTAMLTGVTLIAPETAFFSLDTVLGRDVTVHPNVVFGPGVVVGDGCEIKSFTHLEHTILEADVKVGPFARSRGGTNLAKGVRVGNFVETKNATLGPGTKAGHLSYLGDAQLGAGVNIGAGTITCNYDGFQKSHTRLGDDAFIGVHTALIAPVSVGEGAYIGTGTVVTQDVPGGALALARARQINKVGYAPRLREMLEAKAKAARETG